MCRQVSESEKCARRWVGLGVRGHRPQRIVCFRVLFESLHGRGTVDVWGGADSTAWNIISLFFQMFFSTLGTVLREK
jgi:hypothetical protein